MAKHLRLSAYPNIKPLLIATLNRLFSPWTIAGQLCNRKFHPLRTFSPTALGLKAVQKNYAEVYFLYETDIQSILINFDTKPGKKASKIMRIIKIMRSKLMRMDCITKRIQVQKIYRPYRKYHVLRNLRDFFLFCFKQINN